MNKPKVALVLGSGAARGLAHIGVLKVLEEKKIPISMVAGTSMGALIAGAYAAGLGAKQMEEIACETNWLRVAKLFFPRRLQREGLLDGRRIEEFLIALIGEQKIEELKIPFAAVATDIWTGEEIVLKSGSLVKAIRASISFPFVFAPVQIDGRFLVDGGVVNPVPVNVAKDMGADFIIAVRSTPACDRQIRQMNSGEMVTPKNTGTASNSTSFFKRFLNFLDYDIEADTNKNQGEQSLIVKPGLRYHTIQVASIMENMILSLRLQDSPPDILISPDIDYYQFMDFTRSREIIEAGEEAARLALENISLDLNRNKIAEGIQK